MLPSTRSLSPQVPAKLSIIVLLSFALAVVSVLAPAASAQETPGGRWEAEPQNPTEGNVQDGGWPATVTAALNLRFLPSLDSAVMAVMPAGSGVQIVGEPENGFVPITYNGSSGYASAAYLADGAAAQTTETGAAAAAVPAAGTDVVSIIYAAAAAYGQSGDDMLRVATCESGLNPYAYNPAGWHGLFQFVPSTFASTPYAGYDIYDPWANANAAAWMWSVGRRGEWTCQ